jgi:protein-L-isoaspartate(D-aspartate) O-methyltransferase
MSDFKTERETMIESQVRPNAVTNIALLKAMLETPRENFVPPSMRSLAYMDGALRVEAPRDGHGGRYLLAPMIFAKLAQLAAIKESDRVLDLAAATGYSTAILAKLAKEVVAVESDAGLAAIAKDALAAAGISNVKLVIAALEDGAPDEGPFDVIFVNGRLGRSPEALFAQLAKGGRLVAVMGSETSPKAHLFTRIDSGLQNQVSFEAGAPLLPSFEAKEAFAF